MPTEWNNYPSNRYSPEGNSTGTNLTNGQILHLFRNKYDPNDEIFGDAYLEVVVHPTRFKEYLIEAWPMDGEVRTVGCTLNNKVYQVISAPIA
ncbi:MAG: hypothetical protein N2691_05590 [Patescibacteria group bacterium]|nr:hypothetical protein [Patescibacteria group bacterium]